MNFNFNETAGVSQSQSLPQLKGNAIYEVTFKGCEIREIKGVKHVGEIYNVLDIKYANNDGYYTDTIFEPKKGDQKRQETEIGGKGDIGIEIVGDEVGMQVGVCDTER